MERGPASTEAATDRDGDSSDFFHSIHFCSFFFCWWSDFRGHHGTACAHDARLDTLSDELCQVNTRVSCIAWRQAIIGGFTVSSSPSPQASEDESDDDGFDGDDADEDDGASFLGDEEMTTSQWITLCHLWQKGEVVLGMKVVM